MRLKMRGKNDSGREITGHGKQENSTRVWKATEKYRENFRFTVEIQLFSSQLKDSKMQMFCFFQFRKRRHPIECIKLWKLTRKKYDNLLYDKFTNFQI